MIQKTSKKMVVIFPVRDKNNNLSLRRTMVIFEKFCSEILGVRIFQDYDNLLKSGLA